MPKRWLKWWTFYTIVVINVVWDGDGGGGVGGGGGGGGGGG